MYPRKALFLARLREIPGLTTWTPQSSILSSAA